MIPSKEVAMTELTPKRMAEAIGVSESSVKRWADEGAIAVNRTPGGHRRIAAADAVRFIREIGLPAVRPELLGLPATAEAAAPKPEAGETPAESLVRALTQDDFSPVLGMITGRFLSGEPTWSIFDETIRPAMERIGQLWQERPDGILIEHQATDLSSEAIERIRVALPLPSENAPVAVGAAGEKDPYRLPSLMAATVLREVGYNAVNLGPETPLPVLAEAADRHRASLVWLSLSTRPAARRARRQLQELADRAGRTGAALIVGGREAGEIGRRNHLNLVRAASMTELAAFGRGLASGEGRP
jgi:excisionase family DNA binding protein